MGYLLEEEPRDTEGDDQDYLIARMKIWVDTETWMPLKCEIYADTEKVKIEIRNLKINFGIPDSEFKFDMPAGANVTTMRFEDTYYKNASEEGKKRPPKRKKAPPSL